MQSDNILMSLFSTIEFLYFKHGTGMGMGMGMGLSNPPLGSIATHLGAAKFRHLRRRVNIYRR